jgi:hypothetical protein
MLTKRFVIIVVLAAVVLGYFVLPFSGMQTIAHLSGTPDAGGTPQPVASPIIGGVVADAGGEKTYNPPPCIDCYFGLWELSLEAGESQSFEASSGVINGFTVSGTVTRTDGSTGETTNIRELQVFYWPTDREITITAGDEAPATVYVFGLVEGHDAIVSTHLTLLGGAAVQAQPRRKYVFVIAKLSLPSIGEGIFFGPYEWPAIMQVSTENTDQITAPTTFSSQETAIDVTSFDENGADIQILEPATLVQVTRTGATGEDVEVWFVGVRSYEPGADPACGWHCKN